METATDLIRKIINFLQDLPLVNDREGRSGLLFEANIDQTLLNLISFDGATTVFFQQLVPLLLQYGQLQDGRYALQALLEAAKNRVGQDKKRYCDTLLLQWHKYQQNQKIINFSYYYIISKYSQLCLDIAGGSEEEGSHVIQWEIHGKDHQKWRFIPIDDKHYRIESKHGQHYCLDMEDGSLNNSAKIIVWHWHGEQNQHWELIKQDDGYFLIKARHSDKCLDVTDWHMELGTEIQQYTISGKDNQKWELRAVDT